MTAGGGASEPTRRRTVRTRLVKRQIVEIRCAWCGQWFEPRTRTARYCRAAHRVAACTERQRIGLPRKAPGGVVWFDGALRPESGKRP